MGNKFDLIIESAMRRYQGNHLVVGDRVKFIDNFLSHDWSKGQASVKLERLRELAECGDNIRISSVKTLRPSTAGYGDFEVVDDIYYDIVREQAPGLYTQMFTVPQALVEWLDDYPNLAGDTPDHQKKSDHSHIKPKEVTVDDNEFSPVKQTGTGEGDRQLLNKNVDIAQAPAAKSYTGNYLNG